MSTHPSDTISLHISPNILVTAMQNVVLSPSATTDAPSPSDSLAPIRPFVSYTQAQILSLYRSPLVSPPRGMPLLKDWFGYAIPSVSLIFRLYHSSETGMNKMPRKRTPMPLPPPLEPETNGTFFLGALSLATSFSPFLASGVIRKTLVQSSSFPFLFPYTHHLLSGTPPACHLPVNVVSALPNG